jgi:uncharacterized protein DUF6353
VKPLNLAGLTRLEKFAIDNSPTILTTIGVVGTVTTAVLAGKATYSATLIEVRDYYDVDDFFNDREKRPGNVNRTTAKKLVERHWKLFVPAVGSGLLTATAIISANRIGTRRAAGIAAAFTLSEKAYSEYRDKIVEKLGTDKERILRDELAQDRVDRNPGGNQIIIAGTDILCYDDYTGRYFTSSMQKLKEAQNELNVQVINNSYASLSELYALLGIPKTGVSDELGWTTDRLLDMKFHPVLSEDGRPCISVDYHVDAVRDYWRNR